MPINLRGDSFQVTIHHNRERYRRSFKDHNEAKVWEAQAKADLVAGAGAQRDVHRPIVLALQVNQASTE